MPKQFYVYTHARPDGSVFYVGKGCGRRARDFSPSRRTAHHRHITEKYGLQNIVVDVMPCESEAAAFALECKLIAELPGLINLTTGGEGASGRTPSPKVLEAFKKQYGPGRVLSEDALARVEAGRAKGRQNAMEWRRSPAGLAHIRALGQKSAAATAALPLIEKLCERCGAPHLVKRPAARYCKPCAKNGARDAKPKPPRKPMGPQTPEARKAIGDARRREAAARERARNDHSGIPRADGLPAGKKGPL